MASATNPTAAERYVHAAKAAGCPADQLRNFLKAGVVLQERQLAASAAARLCDHPDGPDDLGYGGARMGGKSHWMLAQMGADDCQRYPGLKCLLLRKVGSAAKEGFEDLLPKVLGPLDRDWVPSAGTLTFPNSSRIKIGNFKDEKDIDKYLGLEYDVIGVEEATLLTARKRIAVKSCCRTTKPGWRARCYYTTNPGGVGHSWFKDLFVKPFRAGTESHTRFIPATVYDNAHAGADYRRFLEGLTGWLKRAWLHGDWDIAAGQYFTTFRREVHLRPLPEIAADWRAWIGLDYGFVHYTAAYPMVQTGDGVIHIVAEHGERRWLVERHAAAIEALCGRRGIKVERLAGIYAGTDVFAKRHTGGTVADDYKAHGLKLKPANTDRINGAAEILRRLGDPDEGIEPTLFLDPSCERLAECLAMLEHDPHRPEDVLKVDCDEDGLGGDDWYDAARYGIMAAANRKTLKVWST